jgi:putative sterol carrier protein
MSNDPTTKQLFNTFFNSLRLERAGDLSGVYQLNIALPAGGSWVIRLEGGRSSLSAGVSPEATVTLSTDSTVFEKIARGQVAAVTGVMNGSLRVEGDRSQLLKFSELLLKPAP